MQDVIIIGCGPAGMTAALYLKRANKKVLILEKETIGGAIASSPLVENYPGLKAISGSELALNMYDQITDLGVDIELEEVLSIEDGDIKTVKTKDGNEYKAPVVIIATGTKYRLLGLPNEEELIGKGIHFCVSCDGAFYKEKTVAVIGGGNSAIVNAITLAQLCKKVYVIQNLTDLTCEETLKEKVKSLSNVEIIYNATVNEIIGDDALQAIVVTSDGIESKLALDGMFVSIGLIPQNDAFSSLIKLDKNKYIKSSDCKTNVDGIFVAGDARSKDYRQITTAVGDGTIAAQSALKYLNEIE